MAIEVSLGVTSHFKAKDLIMDDRIQRLGERCVAHLAHEADLLQSVGELATEMRQALLNRNGTDINLLIDRQEGMTQSAERIAARREFLRAEIAKEVSVSKDAATVGLLARRCHGSVRESLELHRARVRRSANEVNMLVNANANLTSQLIELIEMVFRRLSGENAVAKCYERSGRTNPL
jgi:hypothetical protein